MIPTDLPGYAPVWLPSTASPQLFVVVDTEEEFDWDKPFSRDNTSVRAMRHIGRLQSVFARRGVVPTYVVDFPVASQRDGFAPLKEFADAGAARIGAHLHPWVNPPFTEPLTRRNSYGFALGELLETEKIHVLSRQIQSTFGCMPAVYKAGRYGFGPSTAIALETLGFTVDVSVNPRMDFRGDGGPSFGACDALPFFFGRRRTLLEIPCTTGYTGIAGRFSAPLHTLLDRPQLAPTRVVGIASRLHVVNKIMLSPEGSTLGEMKALTRSLLRRGVRTFSLTMHSPSVEPGCTPYVGSAAELDEFLHKISDYCDYFVGELGGVAGTPEDWYESLGAATAPHDLQERCS
jgi:hypothetical protein